MVTATRSRSTRKASSSTKPVKTYDSALKYLYAQTDYEKMIRVRYNCDTFNLNRMSLLLKKLRDPHKKIRTVHIAGTKGKGSTATMLASMLKACGYSVGLFTSPHICDIRERISINDEMISRAAMTRRIAAIQPHVEKMAEKPTFFEIMTAIAFSYFAEQKVDIAIIECGLGGRLDNALYPSFVLCLLIGSGWLLALSLVCALHAPHYGDPLL